MLRQELNIVKLHSMSFWNFIGGFAIFNMIYSRLSGKPKQQSPTYQPPYDDSYDPAYKARVEELQRDINHYKTKIAECQRIIDKENVNGIEDMDEDELQERIDRLEEQLDSCNVLSDRYDRIQNEIDRLQERLDYMEENQYLYNDLQNEPADPYYDFNDDLDDDFDDDLDDEE